MGRVVREVETSGAHNYTYWVSAMPGIIAFHAAYFDSVTVGMSGRQAAAPAPVPVMAIVAPQPVQGAAQFTLTGRRTGKADLFDAQGQHVSRLEITDGAARWDGRKSDGIIAPAGIYFYRIDAGASSVTGSFIKTAE
jgi:hypothetical protein